MLHFFHNSNCSSIGSIRCAVEILDLPVAESVKCFLLATRAPRHYSKFISMLHFRAHPFIVLGQLQLHTFNDSENLLSYGHRVILGIQQ